MATGHPHFRSTSGARMSFPKSGVGSKYSSGDFSLSASSSAPRCQTGPRFLPADRYHPEVTGALRPTRVRRRGWRIWIETFPRPEPSFKHLFAVQRCADHARKRFNSLLTQVNETA